MTRTSLSSFIAGLALILAFAHPGAAAQIGAGPIIQASPLPSQFVTLIGRPVNIAALTYGYDFQRIKSDGTVTGTCNIADSSGCFRVPAGKVFVITDITWMRPGPGAEGLFRSFALQVSAGATILYMTNGSTDAYGYWRGSEHLSGGIVIGASVTTLRASLEENSPGASVVLLYGYLAAAR